MFLPLRNCKLQASSFSEQTLGMPGCSDGRGVGKESSESEDGEDEEEKSAGAASGSESAQEEEDRPSGRSRRASSRLRLERSRPDDCDGDMGNMRRPVRARVATRTHVAPAEAARPCKRAAPPAALILSDFLHTTQHVILTLTPSLSPLTPKCYPKHAIAGSCYPGGPGQEYEGGQPRGARGAAWTASRTCRSARCAVQQRFGV